MDSTFLDVCRQRGPTNCYDTETRSHVKNIQKICWGYTTFHITCDWNIHHHQHLKPSKQRKQRSSTHLVWKDPDSRWIGRSCKFDFGTVEGLSCEMVESGSMVIVIVMDELTHFLNPICTNFSNARCSFLAVIQNFASATNKKLRLSLSLDGQNRDLLHYLVDADHRKRCKRHQIKVYV